MGIIETFIAYDEQENEFEVNVYGVAHEPISGQSRIVKDYSLASTGEVLQPVNDIPGGYLIQSTGKIIVDIRGINV